ncbi:ATP-binding protein [Streptacidiphilus sp. MAP12-16]|uniref:ATP-binding protein n=1 Tax=Streptacidiphilus sp. MAP12-16 TaxID=3156300 RepID=UPI00351691DC
MVAFEPAPAVPSLCCEFPAEPVATQRARRLVREHYGGCGPPDVLGDLELVVTELIANAVAASASGEGVGLSVRPSGPDLLVEVHDRARAVPVRRSAEVLGEDGRGLLLVGQLSQGWGWHPADGGKVVWALVRLASQLPVPETVTA